MKKIIFRILILAVVLAAGWGGYRLFWHIPQRQVQVPTALVRRGDVVIRSYSRGELRAVRSVTLNAPNLYGTVQVTRLAPAGAFARDKDLIVEFDDSEVLSRLEEKQLELEQTDEQIKKQQAELAIRNNQDQVELLRTRYSVRRAELEVKRNDLLPEIDKRRNLLNLDEARRRLTQLESDIKSRLQQAEAELAVLREERNRAVLELSREKQRLTQTKILSPITGLVSIQQNRFGGMRMFGTQVPDIREGDQVQPGMPVADVLDLSELEVLAKVGELDRANIREGQDVTIQLDALAEKKIHGKIKSMSGTASANVWSGDPSKKFDVTFAVDMNALLAAVGATPEQIRGVMETAARNRSKPMVQTSAARMGGGAGGGMFFGSPGAMSGGASGMPAMMGGSDPGGGQQSAGLRMSGAGMAQGAAGQEGEGGRSAEGRRRGGLPGGGQVSEEDRKKMREALQKELGSRSMQDLSPEERQKVFAKIREKLGLSAGRGSRGARDAGQGGPGESGRPGGPPTLFGGSGSAFSEKELAEAKLPRAPEEESQLEVLIRPGLLADVEIIVEKLSNATYIPAQAVIDKDGKPVVYVKVGRRFEERTVRFSKQSESMMVVASGLKPGDVVALADPNAKKTDKKGEKPSGGSGPAGGSQQGGRS